MPRTWSPGWARAIAPKCRRWGAWLSSLQARGLIGEKVEHPLSEITAPSSLSLLFLCFSRKRIPLATDTLYLMNYLKFLSVPSISLLCNEFPQRKHSLKCLGHPKEQGRKAHSMWKPSWFLCKQRPGAGEKRVFLPDGSRLQGHILGLCLCQVLYFHC